VQRRRPAGSDAVRNSGAWRAALGRRLAHFDPHRRRITAPRRPFDLACAPGFPGPPSSHRHLPSRFCENCSIETTEATCFVCGLPTGDKMPSGWYRGAMALGARDERERAGEAIDNLAIPDS